MTTLITAPPLPDPAPPPLMTAEEFFARYPDHGVELARGVVKEMPMPGGKHGFSCFELARLLGNHVRGLGLGRVVGNDTFFITRRNPDSVRGMDAAHVSYAKLPKGALPSGPLEVAPELVVEVRSPSDAWAEVFAKVEEYLAAGVTAVVLLDPESRTASCCRANASQETFRPGEPLTFPDVLPGFSAAVDALFE